MRKAAFIVFCSVFIFALSHADAANNINWTFYGPGAGGKMQGGLTAASNNLDGNNAIKTLDDVRTGKSKYVTLASATSMRGKFFCIGTVTYTSPQSNGGDGQTHTIENVVGYVHDTGCAFNGNCSCGWLPQFCNGQQRTDKMDIAVGNFSGYDGQYAMKYITGNKNTAPKQWTQIAGLPSGAADPSKPCGGQPKEDGTGAPATYNPPQTLAPQPLSQQPYMSQQPYQAQPYQSGSAPTGGSAVSGPGAQQPTVVGGAYASPGYYGAQYPQDVSGGPIPSQTTYAQSSSTILTNLFQTAPATSGIRVLQSAAQSITDLFQNQQVTHQTQPQSKTSQTVIPLVVTDADDVSLMGVSQYDQPVQQAAATQSLPAVREAPDTGVPQQNTFSSQQDQQQQLQYQPAASPIFLTTMQLILSSLSTILQSLIHMFSQR